MKSKYFTMSLVCLFIMGVVWLIKQSKSSEERSQKSFACDTQAAIPTGITAIESFNDIRSELDNADHDTLVIFDIDDVLITYNEMVLRPCGARFR